MKLKCRNEKCSKCDSSNMKVIRLSGIAKQVATLDVYTEVLADLCIECGHIEEFYAERLNDFIEEEKKWGIKK